MARPALFEWHNREYAHNPKSADWYWALGIIAAAAVIASALFGNYLLAVLAVIAALALALHAAKQPPLHTFRSTEQGLLIGEELHPYKAMKSFSMLEHVEGELPPWISIKVDSWLSPHLVIPLEGVDADGVYAHFLAHVEEDEHHHAITDLVATWLGF